MPEDAPRPAQAAIRTDLGAIFVSLELSRRAWLSISTQTGPRISVQSEPIPAVEERSSPEPMEGTRARRAVPSRATERRAWGGAVGPRGRSAMGSDGDVRCGS